MNSEVDLLTLSSRVVVVGVFVASGLGKGVGFRRFQATLHAIGIPNPLTAASAVGLIAAELAVAMLIAFAIAPRFAGATALALLASFIVVSGWAAFAGRKIPCNCFGQGATQLGGLTAVRAVLLAVPVAVYIWLQPLVESPGDTLAAFVTAGTLAASLVLLASWSLNTRALLALRRERHGHA